MSAGDIHDLTLRQRCLARRQAAARESVKAAGLDGLIAYGSGRHSFLASNPAWHLSGLRQLGPHMAFVAPVDAEPFLVVTPTWDRGRLAERSAFELIAVEPDAFLATLQDMVDRRGFRKARFAVAGGLQPRAVSEAWAKMFDDPIAPGDGIVSDLSRVRDEWSLACAREAAKIAEIGWRYALSIARPGLAEFVLAAEVEAFMRSLGAEDNFQLLSASQHNRAAHRPSHRLLERGDVVLGEITPAVEGEYVQICRTAVLGEPTELQRKAFALLDRALHGAMQAARPGARARDIVHVMNAPIIDAGYEPYTKPPYMRTRGHSMALGSMCPEIAVNSDEVLLEGMMFVLHPNQYIPETGYMMCGEPVLVTKHGAQPLTSQLGRLEAIAV